MKEMLDLLRQAQTMQSKMLSLQEDLAKKIVEGSSGGGMVRATVNGRLELVRLQIEKSAVDPDDTAMLEDLVIAAVNDAVQQARQLAEREMGELTKGVSIPGLL